MAKRKAKQNEEQRIHIEFPVKSYERFKALKEMADSTSNVALIRNALRVYEWVVEQEQKGNQIGIIKDGKVMQEVKFFF